MRTLFGCSKKMSATDATAKPGYFWKFYPVACLAGVALFLAEAGYQTHQANLTKAWLKTKGKIVESTWEYIPGGESAEYSPLVTYGYSVGDGRYIGHRVYLRDGVYSRGGVEEFLAQFPAGMAVDVYYSAANPAESVLRPGSPPLGWGQELLFGLLVLGGIFAIYQIPRVFRT